MREEKRSEIIHDALNMLDDEMIEEVEKLRGGIVAEKKSTTEIQKEIRPWRKWVAIAASVCIVILAGNFLSGNFGELTIPKLENADQMNDENILDVEDDMESKDNLIDAIPESDNLTGEQVDDEGYDELYDEETETEIEGTEIEE